MTTDLPALDTYDAELSDIARRYDPKITAAFLATEAAREALADAEREHAMLLDGRTLEVHQARVRFLDDTRTEIVDGQLRARRGRPPVKREPAPVLGIPVTSGPNGTTEPAIVEGVADASAVLASPAGEAPTATDAFIDAVCEPERTLTENGFSREEIVAMPVAERWTLQRGNVQRKDVIRCPDGWREPIAGEDCPF